jgi:hypothetical protein
MIWALSIGTAAIVMALLALHWHALWWVALVLIVVAGVGYAAGAAAQEGETRVDPEE